MSTKAALTYADYAAIPADGLRHEIIDGEHIVNPAPNLYHQHVSRHLQLQLLMEIELKGFGIVVDSPVDLQLGPNDIVQPDLVFVSTDRKSILTPTKIKGVPDLVVEILFPSNTKHDTIVKRQLYERAGISEYWIVDPEEHSLLQLVYDNGAFREVACYDEVTMTIAPYVRADLKRIW